MNNRATIIMIMIMIMIGLCGKLIDHMDICTDLYFFLFIHLFPIPVQASSVEGAEPIPAVIG